MKLVIFDLDQTLVELFSIHNKVTGLTFKKVFNVNARLDEIPFVGKTIDHNLSELAKLKGVNKKDVEQKIPLLIKTYSHMFKNELKKRRVNALKGARQLIKKLYNDNDKILMLLTGDSKDIATSVLKKINLLKYFSFIVTGEKEKSRVRLIKEAVKKARRKYKRNKIGIIVIGDSVNDVKAGKAVKALIINVLTGFNTRNDLKKAGADYVFKNLADKRIYNIINRE